MRLGRWRGRGSGFSHASHFSGWRQLESGQPPPRMSMISLGPDQLSVHTIACNASFAFNSFVETLVLEEGVFGQFELKWTWWRGVESSQGKKGKFNA